jgi:histidinol-phosphate aminotransferase
MSELKPYSVGPTTGHGLRLHLNEFRFEHAPKVSATIRECVAAMPDSDFLSTYPTGTPPKLLKQIADYVGVLPENVAVSAGSDEALRAVIGTAGLRKQNDVIVGVPTYTHFAHYAKLQGLTMHEYSIGFGTSLQTHRDLLNVYKKVLIKGALVYIGNPNNPTGDLWDVGTIIHFAKTYPRSTFLVDEAYTEFAGASELGGVGGLTTAVVIRDNFLENNLHLLPPKVEDHGPKKEYPAHVILNAWSLAKLAAALPNVIVTRTFSKALGLAALRAGYLIGTKNTVKQLNLALSPKAVGKLAIRGTSAVLDFLPHYLETTLAALSVTRELMLALRKQGWKIYPNTGKLRTNFFLVYVGNTHAVLAHFEQLGIFLRNRSDQPGLAGFIRVSSGTKKEADAVLCAFKALSPPQTRPIQDYYTPKDKIAKLRLLYTKTAVALKRGFLRCWMHGGSLLGVIRHGGIIPWDDDIDLAYEVRPDGHDPMEDLDRHFKEQGLTLQRNRTDAYWQVGTNPPHAKVSEIHIDIFPMVRAKDENGQTTYVVTDPRFQKEAPKSPQAHCNLSYRKGELHPLRTAKFYGQECLIPNASETVLTRALDPTWRTMARIRGPKKTTERVIRDYAPA